MSQSDLFGPVPQPADPAQSPTPEPPSGPPRLLRPDRHQIRLTPTDLESLLPEDHPGRAIWAVVEKLDLSKFEATILSREETAGRPAIDPRILVALWVYATSQGESSAREVERLCEAHSAYRWICGGVHVNHHALSDFRVGHGEALDALFTQVLGVLTHQGLVELRRVAQDGMRVRASAGAASFRREKSLKRCLEEARQQVQDVKALSEEGDLSSKEAARRKSAAEDRLRRVERALEELPKVQEARTQQGNKTEARVSTTDPEARVMKMADGGFRPAYNAQFATDTQTRVIVGVEVTNQGTDMGQIPPMLKDVKERHGKLPDEDWVDGGFAKKEDIQAAADQGIAVYAPVLKPKKEGVDPYVAKPGDSPGVAAWRQRMGRPEAKEIYKERAATAETTNADLRCNRALDGFLVRTIPKVRCVVLWAALTYNLLKLIAVM